MLRSRIKSIKTCDTWIYMVSCASKVTHEMNFLCQPTVKTYKDSFISF